MIIWVYALQEQRFLLKSGSPAYQRSLSENLNDGFGSEADTRLFFAAVRQEITKRGRTTVTGQEPTFAEGPISSALA